MTIYSWWWIEFFFCKIFFSETSGGKNRTGKRDKWRVFERFVCYFFYREFIEEVYDRNPIEYCVGLCMSSFRNRTLESKIPTSIFKNICSECVLVERSLTTRCFVSTFRTINVNRLAREPRSAALENLYIIRIRFHQHSPTQTMTWRLKPPNPKSHPRRCHFHTRTHPTAWWAARNQHSAIITTSLLHFCLPFAKT